MRTRNCGRATGPYATFQIAWPFGHAADSTRIYEDVLARLTADPAIQVFETTFWCCSCWALPRNGSLA